MLNAKSYKHMVNLAYGKFLIDFTKAFSQFYVNNKIYFFLFMSKFSPFTMVFSLIDYSFYESFLSILLFIPGLFSSLMILFRNLLCLYCILFLALFLFSPYLYIFIYKAINHRQHFLLHSRSCDFLLLLA